MAKPGQSFLGEMIMHLRLSFRTKLMLAMMLVVVGVSLATMRVTQGRVQAHYDELFRDQFQRQIAFFSALQDARLSTVREQCLKLSRSVRIEAALVQKPIDVNLLYDVAEAELREVTTHPDPSDLGASLPVSRRMRATFVRFVDGESNPLIPPEGAGLRDFSPALHRELERRLPMLRNALRSEELQQVAYGALGWENLPGGGARLGLLHARDRSPDRPNAAAPAVLHEVVLTRILSREHGHTLGGLILGFALPELVPAPRAGSAIPASASNLVIRTGMLLENRLFANTNAIAEPLADAVATMLGEHIRTDPDHGDFGLRFEGVPYRVGYKLLNPASDFPPAWQVSLYSLTVVEREKARLRLVIYAAGAAGLVLAFLLSLFISNSLATPLRQIVAGTHAIAAGNYEVRVAVRSADEIGQLGKSFNKMAQGLALKEKYRTILNMVADEKVAQRLVDGHVRLGGELREISVLFCDIRGFTALTQNLPPAEIIELLNEHMTALTAVVKRHHGVLDKFVGDLLMAIFGAPLAHGNDTGNAAACALELLQERARLNETSRHRIEVGVGVATGMVVAGCMGSADRLNYTVLGERVNLASRLCAQAGAGEVLVDDNTIAKLGGRAVTESKGVLQLKGFSAPVPAFRLVRLFITS